jgi:sulfur-carrier protein
VASVKVLYFAWLRERIGRGEERLDVPASVETIADLVSWLKARGPEYASAFADEDRIRAAIDQRHVAATAPISNASEIAFFPPVTGG